MSALFPDRDARDRINDSLMQALSSAENRLAQGPVTPDFDPALFRRELHAFDFQAPCALDDVLAWTIAQLEHGLVHITHPRYFGLFNPGPSFPAQCGDRITAVFNPQLATRRTSPAAVAIEAHVIRAVAARAGLPSDAAGHFATGGSEANFTALLCALAQANERFVADGARAFAGPPVFYISADSHLAWIKLAAMAGLGRNAARLVPTDGAGSMDIAALETMIARDREAGSVPVMLVATAGTTNAGMIDPLAACAARAQQHGLWLHIDAAWAGALIASKRLGGVLAGIERADSVTIDAHKWFATTMSCGMFLTAHTAVLARCFAVATSFMPSNDATVDPYLATVQWSRRFIGLRLFLSLATAGWAGYAEHVERTLALTDMAEQLLAERGWHKANNSRSGVLCVVPPVGEPRMIVDRVVESGRAWVAATHFEGRDVVRICVTHGETTPEDVRALVATLVST